MLRKIYGPGVYRPPLKSPSMGTLCSPVHPLVPPRLAGLRGQWVEHFLFSLEEDQGAVFSAAWAEI